MENVRTAGVLLHLTSLPGPYGIGVMGEEAERFVLLLQRMGFHYWQVLPLCPVDDTGSPYCSYSANAGYPALIDPRALVKDGLLTQQEAERGRYDGSIYIGPAQVKIVGIGNYIGVKTVLYFGIFFSFQAKKSTAKDYCYSEK